MSEANYSELYPSIYERYECDPRKQFFWKKWYVELIVYINPIF